MIVREASITEIDNPNIPDKIKININFHAFSKMKFSNKIQHRIKKTSCNKNEITVVDIYPDA